MRSLWRTLALQWLGGDGSEGLTGDSTVLESLRLSEPAETAPAFDVRGEIGVSHQAMLSTGGARRPDPEYSLEGILRAGRLSDYHLR